ncbi:hypothetical protein TWF730_010688 [Orbilia blumenaviensis]|uniref:Uncharacterized protein n=1 Tax=Orbilia blumenaviensis TaxID=1796055 RepID=A0AAV9UP03_9PEZI
MTAPFPFLSLPREIRDEVYTYIVHFPVPPIPSGRVERSVKEHYVLPHPGCELELSILRVNRQIHLEASEALYSRNVFHFQVVTSSSVADTGPREYVRAYYDSPWENLVCFRQGTVGHLDDREIRENFRSTPLISYFGPRKVYKSQEGTRVANGVVQLQLPPLRYRHLIRHIRFDVRDFRTCPLYNADDDEDTRDLMRETLLPFAHRLKDVLSDAGEKAHVKIVLESDIGNYEHAAGVSKTTQTQRDGRYEGLVEMVWPLTNGPWRSTILLSKGLDQQFGGRGITERVLAECHENTGSESREEGQDMASWKMQCYWNFKASFGIRYEVRGEEQFGTLVKRPEMVKFSDTDT